MEWREYRSIEEFQKFLNRKVRLPEDAFQCSPGQVFVLNGNGNFKFRPRFVE